MSDGVAIITKEQMEIVDKLYPPPDEQAAEVYALIRGMAGEIAAKNKEEGREEDEGVPTDMNLLCFAVEYMAQQSIVIGEEDFMKIAQVAVRWLYSVHYSNPGRIYGDPPGQGSPHAGQDSP